MAVPQRISASQVTSLPGVPPSGTACASEGWRARQRRQFYGGAGVFVSLVMSNPPRAAWFHPTHAQDESHCVNAAMFSYRGNFTLRNKVLCCLYVIAHPRCHHRRKRLTQTGLAGSVEGFCVHVLSRSADVPFWVFTRSANTNRIRSG